MNIPPVTVKTINTQFLNNIEKYGYKAASLLKFLEDDKLIVPFTLIQVKNGEIISENLEKILFKLNSLNIPLILRGSAKNDGEGLIDIIPTTFHKKPIKTSDLENIINSSLNEITKLYAKLWDKINDYDGVRSIIIQPDLSKYFSNSNGSQFKGSYLPHPNLKNIYVISIEETWNHRLKTRSVEYISNNDRIVKMRPYLSYNNNNKIAYNDKDLIKLLQLEKSDKNNSFQREILYSLLPEILNQSKNLNKFNYHNHIGLYSFNKPSLYFAQERKFLDFKDVKELSGGYHLARYGIKPNNFEEFKKIKLNNTDTNNEEFIIKLESNDTNQFKNNLDVYSIETMSNIINSPYLKGIIFDRDDSCSMNGTLGHESYRFIIKSPYSIVEESFR